MTLKIGRFLSQLNELLLPLTSRIFSLSSGPAEER